MHPHFSLLLAVDVIASAVLRACCIDFPKMRSGSLRPGTEGFLPGVTFFRLLVIAIEMRGGQASNHV